MEDIFSSTLKEARFVEIESEMPKENVVLESDIKVGDAVKDLSELGARAVVDKIEGEWAHITYTDKRLDGGGRKVRLENLVGVKESIKESKPTHMKFSVDLRVVVDDVPTKGEIEELLADKYGSATIYDFELVESKLAEAKCKICKKPTKDGEGNPDVDYCCGHTQEEWDKIKESVVNEDALKDKRKFDLKQNIAAEVFPAIQTAMKISKEQYPDMTEEEFYDVIVPASKEAVLSLGLQFKEVPANVPEPIVPQKLERESDGQ